MAKPDDLSDDLSDDLEEVQEDGPEPAPGRLTPERQQARGRRRWPWVVALLLVVLLVVLGLGGLAGGGGLAALAFFAWRDTPERTLASIREALDEARVADARAEVSPSAWPLEQAAVPPGLYQLVKAPELQDSDIPWTVEEEERVVYSWHSPTPLAEVTERHSVELRRSSSEWLLTDFEPGWGDDVDEVLSLLADMRGAARRRDASGFLQHAEPGEDTCTSRTCPIVVKAIEAGEPHLFVETIDMTDQVDGSLRVDQTDDVVKLTWLRRTRFLDRAGVIALTVDEVDGRWKVVSVDARHFDRMNDEMDVWTENHGEMLWRIQLKSLVEVGSRKSFCGEYDWYGRCITTVHPTYVHNVGERPIRRIRVSKNRYGRRFSDSTQTLWGVYANIAPEQTVDDPVDWSPPILTKPNAKHTFNFYRVDWVVFEDGERMEYASRDYREELLEGLTFDLVLETRRSAGSDLEDFETLQAEVEDHGYSLDEVARLMAPPDEPTEP